MAYYHSLVHWPMTMTSCLKFWILQYFFVQLLTPRAAAKGDPTRIPTGDELTGLIPKSSLKVLPGNSLPRDPNNVLLTI